MIYRSARNLYLLAVTVAGLAAARPAAAQTVTANAETADATTRAFDALLDRRVSLDVKGVPLKRAIDAATSNARVPVQYRARIVDAYDKLVTLRVVNVPLRTALDQLLAGTMLRVVPDGLSKLMIVDGASSSEAASPQGSATIAGRILDSASSRPLEGATITFVGTEVTTISNREGRYVLSNVPAGQYSVIVRKIGYEPLRKVVTIKTEQQNVVDFVLSPRATRLAEVLTTATGQQERFKIGNDITKLNVDSILQTAPVANMSELLTARVPGVVVMKSSGAPGAPSKIRIRGINSMTLNNDPIIIVDGIRIYSSVSQQRDQGVNARSITAGTDAELTMLAPSPLDQIDLNSVESVEVLKGPSAGTLYGTDAANGVIVVTTKRGRPGPTRWTFSTTQGLKYVPGKYPLFYRRLGHVPQGAVVSCPIGYVGCVGDSVVTWQSLNDERTTVLGRGTNQAYSMSVTGGPQTVTYFMSVSGQNELGYAKMPDAERIRIERETQSAVPNWQHRPQGMSAASATVRMNFQANPKLGVDVGMSLFRQTTRTTPLAGVVRAILSDPEPDDSTLLLRRLPSYRERTTTQDVTARFSAKTEWRPFTRLLMTGIAGWDKNNGTDRNVLRRDDCTGSCGAVSPGAFVSAGFAKVGQKASNVITGDVRGSFTWPSFFKVGGTTTLGLQYTKTTTDDLESWGTGLAVGSTSIRGATTVASRDETSNTVVAGVYFEHQFNLFNQIYTGFALRRDGGSGLGVNVNPNYPKLNFSFPIIRGSSGPFGINSLLLRTAFGVSGQQPDVLVKLRTFGTTPTFVDGTMSTGFELAGIGNSVVRPERSIETEGGFDVDFFQSRLNLGFTIANRHTRDYLVDITTPTSVGGFTQKANLGTVQNRSLAVQIQAIPIQTRLARLGFSGYVERRTNVLKKLGQTNSFLAAAVLNQTTFSAIQQRYVVGYPLSGIWTRSIVSYADTDGDGVILRHEVQLSDSTRFAGGPIPSYALAFSPAIGLFNDYVNIHSTFNYTSGQIQINRTAYDWVTGSDNAQNVIRELNDPTTSLADQAVVRSGLAFVSTVSAFRFETFSISAMLPRGLTQRLRASRMSVALQGSNLGLWSNYTGKDPNVRSSMTTEYAIDSGILPPPRTWSLRVDLGL